MPKPFEFVSALVYAQGKVNILSFKLCLFTSQEYKWDPQGAIEEIKRKRPQVKPNKSHWNAVNSYYYQTKL